MKTIVRRANSAQEFIDAAPDAEYAGDHTHYLNRLFDSGSSKLEWCFVAERCGKRIGRVAFWSLPDNVKPLDIVLFDTTWHQTDWDLGRALLAGAFAAMRSAGLEDVGYCQDTPPRPPQWQTDPELRNAFLSAFGFTVVRKTTRFELADDAACDDGSCPLTFAQVTAAEEQALVDMVARVALASSDQPDRDACAAVGAMAHATALIDDARSMRWQPQRWQWGLNQQGERVGFVLPTAGADFGMIGYIGVDPVHRGHGCVDHLLRQGVRSLRSQSFPRIVADTDQSNGAMAAAFERGGWRSFGDRVEWKFSRR
jgi:ribosomal protein S18 acetylase RimI-like enzyme